MVIRKAGAGLPAQGLSASWTERNDDPSSGAQITMAVLPPDGLGATQLSLIL